MKVKNKLSLQFTLMFAILLITVLAGIYFFVEHNRVRSFDSQLDNRALIAAQFYLAEDNLSQENFNGVLKKFPRSLSNESIRIYDDKFEPQFIKEDTIRWSRQILAQVVHKGTVHISAGTFRTSGLYYQDNSGNFIILVSAIDVDGLREMGQLRLIMLFFFLLSMFITFVMGRLFSKIALIPITRITKELKLVRSSTLDSRLVTDLKKTDEIHLLSVTINQLLEHLEQSFGSQKSFIAHASHELRTPITMILGEAETTLMKKRDAETYEHALQTIAVEAERLRSIISSLMDLMQTNLESLDFQEVRMDELLWQILDEHEAQSAMHVRAIYDLPSNPAQFTISGNRQLLFIAIGNIIKNAVKFSGGKDVTCKIYCDPHGVYIQVTDQGIGISEIEMEKVFQPFYRSPNALGYPGNGIGLSLTQNIVKVHGGTIKLTSVINSGTTFVLFFPVYRN